MTDDNIQAFQIAWTEYERGWGQRSDGYSFHKTAEAAEAYLTSVYDRLPAKMPDEYSYPSNGWREPAVATPVLISADGLIAKKLGDKDSVRIWRSFGGEIGERYQEARSLKAAGADVAIHYGQTPYSAGEIANASVARVRIGVMVSELQARAKCFG